MKCRSTEETEKRLVWDKESGTFVEPVSLPYTEGMTHYQFPAEAMETLCAQKQDATLAVLLNIARLWFRDFGRNPVQLGKTDVRGFQVSKDQKSRALEALERAGFIKVERRSKRSPLVTLTWKPKKK